MRLVRVILMADERENRILSRRNANGFESRNICPLSSNFDNISLNQLCLSSNNVLPLLPKRTMGETLTRMHQHRANIKAKVWIYKVTSMSCTIGIDLTLGARGAVCDKFGVVLSGCNYLQASFYVVASSAPELLWLSVLRREQGR